MSPAQKNKKIIFIGGVSYSGTTLLDMILGHDTHGFSGGEIQGVFLNKEGFDCACKKDICDIWNSIKKSGYKNVYDNIFKMLPEIKFIVDSSKSIYWIEHNSNVVSYPHVHLLIFKSPVESAFSFKKRGKLHNWEQEWVNYHLSYFNLFTNWTAIAYSKLVHSSKHLENLCKSLDIPYFLNKHKYWLKQHHTIGGNLSTKIHTFNNDQFNAAVKKLHNSIPDYSFCQNKIQSLYYDNIDNKTFQYVTERKKINPIISDIETVLQLKQDFAKEADLEASRLIKKLPSPPVSFYKRFRYRVKLNLRSWLLQFSMYS